MFLFSSIIYWLVTNVFGDFRETTEFFAISEEAAVGSLVGQLHLTSDFNYRVSGVNHYFDFDPVTGWISLRQTLDREELHNDTLELLLVSTPPSLIHVFITVLDVNDNTPRFPVPFQNISVIESSAVGTRIPLLPAVDTDAGDNGAIVEYGIEDNTTQFELVYENPGLLYLEVKQPLDRESNQMVVLNVSAKDGGIPSRIGYATLYVDIVDVNDNAPTFEARELETKWTGSAMTPILILNATDADRGKNGEITYSIPGPESEHFFIDGNRVFARKDSPACCPSPPCSVCFVSLRAADHGTPPLESTALLRILLSNENLHDPQITIRLHPSTVDFALIETGATAGKAVAVLTVTDEDGPLTESSSVWIESGNEDGVFVLSVQKQFSILKLLVNAPNITKSQYNLVFVASDGQLPQRLTNATLKVYNEAKLTTSPVVVEQELSVSISEDSPVGTFVAQVHTNSSGCKFVLNDDVPFAVDWKSGIITTTSTLDVNIKDNYALEVMVQPPPPSIHSVMATVTVMITDVNDHAPSLIDLPDRLLIPEDTTDRGDNALLLYRLLNGIATEYLSMDSASGKCTLKKAVDFETIQGFDLEIEVCDHGRPELCSSTNLPVFIQDINDNAPEFPCTVIHSVLPLNSSPGTVVATVFAKDRDSGSAGQVHYALLDAITGFSIDSSSGIIQTTGTLQAEQYSIRIGASDGHGVMSTSNVTVTLFTTKEKPLKWTSGPNTIELEESTSLGDTLAVYHTSSPSSLALMSDLLSINSIGSLSLAQHLPIIGNHFYEVLIAQSDQVSITKCIELHVIRDSPKPSFPKKSVSLKLKRNIPLGEQLMKVDAGGRFNFSTDCRWLHIDSDGVVSVRQLIDKSINSVKCEIDAKDWKGRSDQMEIWMTMENEERPFRLNATYNVHVKRSARVGTILTRLGNDSAYVYKNVLKTSVDVFPDGSVYLKGAISDGGPDLISLPVTATHRFLNNTYSTMVHVFLDEVNIHKPRCSLRKSFEIEENLSVGSAVGYLEAEDDDVGLGGVIGYRLLDNQNLIRIGTVSGKITTATIFDAESLEKVDFKYEVYDHGSPSKAVICNGTIMIVDVNDNAPVFDRGVYRAAINVNSLSENRTIVVVKAKDKDRTAEITYKLLNYLHLFEIDKNAGIISRKGLLRPDSRFNISIAAIDEVGKLATTVLIVTTSSNDSIPPVFEKSEPFRFLRTTLPVSIIGRVRAVSGQYVINYRITDERFDVDSWGNVILTGDSMTSGDHEFIVTASTAFHNSTAVQKVKVEIADAANGGGRTFRVKENSAPETITSLDEDSDILLTVPPTSAFKISGQKLVLVKPLDYEISSTYQLLVGNKRNSQLITIEVIDIADNDLECDETTFIVDTLPFSTPLHCKNPISRNTSRLTYRTMSSEVKVSEDGQLSTSILKEMVTSVAVDVLDNENSTTRRSKTFTIRLIRGTMTDESISFPSKEISLLVASSQPIQTTLGRITAESALPLKYYVVGSSYIQIDEDSGVVSTRRKNLIDVTETIVAVSPTGITTTQVRIEVIEDSLALSKDLFLFVPSSLSAGQTIGRLDVGRNDVSLELSDPYIYNRGLELILKKDLDFGPATYSIIGDIGLSVDGKNGIIKTTTVFDHEEKQLYSFKLKSTFQSGEFIEQESVLVIDDENDNSPKFNSDLYSVEIVEDVKVGTEIARLKWSDNDFNNAFHLAIEEGNELRQFDVDSDGRVKVIGELDRERLPVHRLVIRLSDGIAPYPYHTTECVVTVTLRDVNDNPPVFESFPEFLVEENSHRMKVIGRVQAMDADEGLNAEIHYRIVPESLPRAEFIIDAVRGDLMVNKPLDSEQTRNYTFTVAAMDHGIPQLVSYQRVTVHVVDVNDHAPILSSSPTTIEIDEVTTRGSPILRLKVDDEDCIENAASVFAIEKGFGVFDVSPISGVLYVSSPLDFESQSLYNVSVSARNIAGGPKTYSSVIVHVRDNNDERPRFIGGSPVQFSIYENLPGPFPAVIGTTISEDLDDGTNGLVAYSIFKGNASLFSINSASGELLLLNSLDREDCMEHFITVQAIDSGTTRLSSTVEIKITVLDDNDNAPEFDQPYYVIHVRENIKHGQMVLKVTAVDKDEGQNAAVRYSLLEQSPFLIDRITGEIRVNSAVDREEINEYRLTIRATDSGRFRRLTSTARLTVFIDDENDNHPIIRNKLLDVFVPKDFRNGDVVHVVDATDPDEDSTLFFNISGTDARFFRIDAKGEIIAKTVLEMKAYYSVTVGVFDKDGLNTSASFTFYLDDRNNFSSRELDYEKRSSHRLWIAAIDSDSPPKQSITSIDIVVEDVNDNTPIFDQVIYSVDVMENSDPTQQLCVSATDRDQGDNANISYFIVRAELFPGNTLGSFTIDHRTGCICTTQMLDRESITYFRLVILAEDQGNPPLSTEAIVKVNVLDEDDNAPKFSHLFHAEIPEDLKVGSPVLMISALDPDGFVNHTFSIDNEATTPFFIHPHTGQIYLQRPLDREQTSMYRLRIRVSDGTWAVQTYAAINVLDVNDNAPVFMKQKYVFIVNDSQVNQTFGKVVARDADEGRNGIVHYRLQRDVRYISIDPITAEMKLLAVPEKEVTRVSS
ncbi:unnamed protein product [Haemonchus placei]|uniref:Cadherin domain protein n=1 Tax=Haemonchus placei TaxID=6290 RepID=A0A158QKV2_HAEPC|nr:unnamed protein product [Haemonchus placei]